ncbi:MAG: YggS family pyridoxal phosphate-dependent enzyme [bacterium]
MITANLEKISEKISLSAGRIGKCADDITLIAVTKKIEPRYITEAVNFGVKNIGESKVQEALDKKSRISEDALWHLIGNLQTNKAKKAVQLFDMIQSVDSVRLAESINKYAEEIDKIQDCLIEIKISDEEAKHGIPVETVDAFLSRAGSWPHMRIRGLMTIAPYFDDREKSRPYFKKMNQLFDACRKKTYADNVTMSVLSMGMSIDFETAIEEGSTMVRIGTAIFGQR